jgi:hypothetical protein
MVTAYIHDSLLVLVDFMLQGVNRRWKMIKPSTKEKETEDFSEEIVTTLCCHISEYHNMSLQRCES